MISIRNACLAVLALALPGAMRAQSEGTVPVAVVDAGGKPIPYAVVSIGAGNSRVADDSGHVRMPGVPGDSLQLRVRRIGYGESYGWVRSSAGGQFMVTLTQLTTSLAAVTVSERANTPLAQRGFYERLERSQRGAVVGEFMTPEDLEARPRSRLTEVVQASRYVRVSRTNPVHGQAQSRLLGRGGCAMNIVLDGQLVTGSAQEDVVPDAPTSINPGGTRQSRMGEDVSSKPDIDQIVNGGAVMAVEIYPSSANAPAELIPFGGNGSCGIIAIWTGPRR